MQTTLDKRTRLNRRMASMRAMRTRHQQSWEEIRDFIAPDAMEDPNAGTVNEGQRRDSAIVNNTPTLALETGVAGLFHGTCNPSEKWIEMEAVDPALNKIHRVQIYCQEVADIILTELARSNFYKQAPEDFRSLLGFGTCATVMQETFKGDAIVTFQSQPIGTYYVANDHERSVNQVARDRRMTAAQMVEKFGDNCSSIVKEAAKDESRAQNEFPVVHMVYPNPSYNPMRGALAADKPYSSCYYEPSSTDADGNKMLEESGFSAFPVACARWNTLGDNPYGFGCGRTAIGDSRALMAMEIDSATAVELQVKPPLLIPFGMQGEPVSLIPGGLTYSTDAASDQGVRPIMEVSHDLSHSTQKINEHEDRIDRAFFVNIFLMITNDPGGKMTATEILERANEKGLALTPILRIGEEYHKPVVRFVFNVAGRRGRLPEIPPELEGQEIKVMMKTVLFQAAELQRSTATRGCVGFAVQVGQTVPSVLDNIDFDKVVRDDFRRNGAPADLLLDPKKVEAKRQAIADAQAKQAQGEAANMAADTAQRLANTSTEGKSALTDIMAGLQQ